MRKKTLKCIFVLVSLLAALPAAAQTPADSVSAPPSKRVRGVQYASRDEAAEAQRQKSVPLFAGASLSGDLAGLVMALATSYGQFEAAARLNFKERYFPTFEMGWGLSDKTDDVTRQHFKTNAPYFRIGCDYNVANDKLSGNRIFVGLRYAFTTFNYDLEGPAMSDPVWGGSLPYDFKGLNSRAQWGEVVFGLEAKIWKIFHLGWSFRYRKRFSQKATPAGQAWYIPGYGKNDGSAWGGTFNLIFDI